MTEKPDDTAAPAPDASQGAAPAPETPASSSSAGPEPAKSEPARPEDSVREAIAQLKDGARPGEVRQRDPKTGQFVHKADAGAEPATQKADAAPAAAPKVSDQDNKPKAEGATSSPPSGPPAGWSADAKALWNQLPPAIQAAVSRRETEVSDGFRQKSEEAKNWQGLNQMFEPRRQKFASMGYQNDGQVLEHLFAFADAYDKDPAGLILHLADNGRINLTQLAARQGQKQQPNGQRPTASAQPQADPAVNDRISRLEQSLTERDRQIAADTLARFAADPKHPHYEEVKGDMARLLKAGETDLERAYETAVWANASTRQKMLDAQKADADAAAKAKAAEKAAAARTAAISPRGSGPNGAAPAGRQFDPSKSDVHGAVREAISQLSGRA